MRTYFLTAFIAVIGVVSLPAYAAATLTECDRLTAHASDPDRIAPGVSSSTMDTDLAIEACTLALAGNPDNSRLLYQMGRAYGTAGRGTDARPYLIAAAEAGYAQSQYVLGYLLVTGLQGEKDTCGSLPWFVASAEAGLLASLVALPYHVLRHDFDDCDGVPSAEMLSNYLVRAPQNTNNYYALLLIDELSSKLEAALAP